MKVLMFGWEFPPHISGGLGTACFGLTSSMNRLGQEITFVLPRVIGNDDEQPVDLVNASGVDMGFYPISAEPTEEIVNIDNIKLAAKKSIVSNELLELIAIDSKLTPYETGEQYKVRVKKQLRRHLRKNKKNNRGKVVIPDDIMDSYIEGGCLPLSGGYGKNLLDEVYRYSLIAYKIAERSPFDIIHAHDWMTYPAGIEAKRASGKPLVIHVHATEFDRTGHHVDQNLYNIERRGMDAADKIIAVSNRTKQIVTQHYGINPTKVSVVHNAVIQDDDRKTDYKRSLKEKVVLFLGRVTSQKGPSYFIEAARLVLDKIDNIRFVMAGNGDLLADMIKTTAAMGMQSHFHFTGFLKGDQLSHIFSITDLCVMPSVSEPFGIVPIEAMRHGLPVIVSKQSGVAEILPNAIKIDFWDTQMLADQIIDILSDEQGYRKMINQNFEDLKSIHWDNSAQKVIDIYKETL